MSDRDVREVGGDIQVIARCAQILRQLQPGQRLGVGPLAKELGVGRSTLHRYLNSLANADLIERVGDGEYAPGPLLAQLGTMALSQLHVVDAAGPPMRTLADEVGESVVLSVWGGLSPVVARMEAPDKLIHILIRIGTALPLSAAQTRVFLAHLKDPQRVEQLLSLVPEERAGIEADVATVRAEGMLAKSGYVVGLTTVAVPVFNSHGITATLGLVGTDAVLNTPTRAPLTDRLVRTAEALSRQLGHTDPYPGVTDTSAAG